MEKLQSWKFPEKFCLRKFVWEVFPEKLSWSQLASLSLFLRNFHLYLFTKQLYHNYLPEKVQSCDYLPQKFQSCDYLYEKFIFPDYLSASYLVGFYSREIVIYNTCMSENCFRTIFPEKFCLRKSWDCISAKFVFPEKLS